LAALAAHFDDLSDLPLHRSYDIIGDYEHPADPARRAQSLLVKVRAGVPEQHQDLFEACLENVYRIETEGRQKNTAPLSPAELSVLTTEKGACSVLLFRCLIDWPLSEAEKQAWWIFGSLLQRCDDAFDVWFDRRDGIQTPARQWLDAGDPVALRNDYQRHIDVTEKAFHKLPVSAFRRTLGWNTAAAIAAIGRVCTNRYVDLQKKHGTLPLDNRKTMVTDMGKWKNRIRALGMWVVGRLVG
jgi:hypothetical protein